MPANNLLYWLSVAKSGSWQQFKSAAEKFNITSFQFGRESNLREKKAHTPYNIVRINFERLGHSEFFSNASGYGWCVCPPTIAGGKKGDDHAGVLAGARSLKLLDRLSNSMPAKTLQILRTLEVPDAIRFKNCGQDQLQETAERLGLLYQSDAARTILASQTPIGKNFSLHEIEVPFGKDWIVERFCPRSLRWSQESVFPRQCGDELVLRRYKLRNLRHQYLMQGSRALQVERSVGEFLLLHLTSQNVLSYLSNQRSIAVPVSINLPVLVERALILQSGNVPSYDPKNGKMIFSHVSPDVAEMAAQILLQELK